MTKIDEVRDVLDKAVSEAGVPGILAEIREHDQTWSEVRERSAEDRFRIGSVTKTFTATVVLQLAAENRLDLDDPVGKWLPGLVARGDEIPVRRLLNHTSGLFNYTQDQPALSTRETYTPHQLAEIAMAHPADFAPGAGWGYSNTNYVLAGMVAERVTGRDLADEITDRVTRPLGLTATRLPRAGDETLGEPHSVHYTKLFSPDPDAEIHDASALEPSPYWAAGGMVSSAGDLLRFFEALLGGRLLPPEQQSAMFTTTPTRDWLDSASYGLGVSSLTLSDGTEVWGMGGALFGSWTYVYGSRDGTHLMAANINADWATGAWDDPGAVLTALLEAGFR
ncbi:D-alanyl-D-alanine carboxypeptidase [Amycolatopsis sp. WAC 01375]|uniref:serine hydrolase domain-containing protein n=1 Tax=Amycolatopsis sp. WAC 01375 TaxID=2203194 RepID=UPI000F766174|nr:serine hydrolase domain-containing protein [Amycolatopsis sp. WAC 01375]RSM77968.1 D-alanyl-D-alanine carboxypeptidase [Amycolatopsis sp. WAC 01375]